MMKRIGVYPGTFDPVTFGHIDIIRRGAKLVDHLVIGLIVVGQNAAVATGDTGILVLDEPALFKAVMH